MVTMPTIENIFPETIRLDGGTQPRSEIDKAVCAEYGEQMKAGDKFPPIDVFFDSKDYWLADGFHRLDAYVMAVPGEAIECNVFKGTLQDAQWHSYGVNKTHGIRRSKKDKERAVKAALAHPAAIDKSNVQIAEHCGVDEKTVRKYRPSRRLTSDNPKSDIGALTSDNPKSRPRKGRDGRTIDTAKIGGYKKRRPSDKPSRHVAGRIAQPTRTPNPMQPMTALNMPHDPFMGAMTLIEVFNVDYLRTLIDTLSKHLKDLKK
jgi:hypothetical protein